MEGWLAAVITGLFGLLALQIQKGNKAQAKDHDAVKNKLDDLKQDVHHVMADIQHMDMDLGVIEAKIDNHINDHAVGVFSSQEPEYMHVKKSRRSK